MRMRAIKHVADAILMMEEDELRTVATELIERFRDVSEDDEAAVALQDWAFDVFSKIP